MLASAFGIRGSVGDEPRSNKVNECRALSIRLTDQLGFEWVRAPYNRRERYAKQDTLYVRDIFGSGANPDLFLHSVGPRKMQGQ
jgi:hypothetical protein